MTVRSVGIIGHGDFGRFLEELARTYVPDREVRIFSRRAEPDGARFFTLAQACASDIVIIASSIREFEETLGKVLPLLRPDSLLVEVNTVKEHPVRLLRERMAGKRYLATHPMFGPYSFRKQGGSLAGLRIVVTDHSLTDADYAGTVAFLKRLGLAVLAMSPEQHDRSLAETLFLTHYVAQSVARAGFVRTDIDTLSFGYLMDAVESVKQDTELFKDVYRFNSYCEEVIARLEAAEQGTHALLGRAGA